MLCPTSKSLTHTDARRAAIGAGRSRRDAAWRHRGGDDPVHERGLPPDCRRAPFKLCVAAGADRSTVRVTAPAGTDITMPIAGRTAHASSGLFREKGLWGNLPTGEAYLAPLEGRSNGVVVVDGSMAGVGMVLEPIRIVVEDGYATDITGGAEAARLRGVARAAREGRLHGGGVRDRHERQGHPHGHHPRGREGDGHDPHRLRRQQVDGRHACASPAISTAS